LEIEMSDDLKAFLGALIAAPVLYFIVVVLFSF